MTEMGAALPDDARAPMSGIRSITPRRSLPSGRAVVGALLVTIAAIGSFVVATGGDSTPDTIYLVAARPIDAGELVSGEDFDRVPIELPGAVAATTVGGTSSIDGATMLRDVRVGELLSARDLVLATGAGPKTVEPMHELTVAVPRNRTSQLLVPGDRVTVLATMPVNDVVTTLVGVEDAVVLDWVTDGEGFGATNTGVLKLALGQADTVMRVAHLALEGEITVVRTTRAIADDYPISYRSGPEHLETPLAAGGIAER